MPICARTLKVLMVLNTALLSRGHFPNDTLYKAKHRKTITVINSYAVVHLFGSLSMLTHFIHEPDQENHVKAIATAAASLFMLMSGVTAQAQGLTTTADGKNLTVSFGQPTIKQTLHYRKMYDKKPFPDAEIYYYDNGVYKIISQGENHYGVYVMQGKFDDETFTVRFISLPSTDWGNKTAFHQLTFVHGDKQNTFIQNAIVDTGEAISIQNGTYTQEKNTVTDPVSTSWEHK